MNRFLGGAAVCALMAAYSSASSAELVSGCQSCTYVNVASVAAKHGASDASGAETGQDTASGTETVVVRGSRMDDTAANLQLNSDKVINVMTEDDIARNPDSNVAETLSRLPGVALLPTTVGGSLGGSAFMADDAARGEGGYVSVRGLSPDYTRDLMDGADIAQGKPSSRQVPLSLLPPMGFSRIVVSKTQSADMDGDNISGIVDFQTATAFDIGKPMLKVSLRGDFSQFNNKFGLYSGPLNGGGLGQVEFADIFAGGHLGVHGTAYYQVRQFSSGLFNENEGSWDFLVSEDGDDNSPVSGMSPTKDLIGEQMNSEVSYGTTRRYGGNLSLDWRGDDYTVFLRASYAASNTEQATIQRGVQATNTDTTENSDGTYTMVEDGIVGTYWFETNPEDAMLANVHLGGSFQTGRLTTKVLAFFSHGEDNRPDHMELGYKNFNFDSDFSLSPTYNGKWPVANLSDAQIAEVNNLSDYIPQTDDNYGSDGVVFTRTINANTLGGGRLDFSYETGFDTVPVVHFGGKYVDSFRHTTSRDYEYDTGDETYLPGLASSLAESSLVNGTIDMGKFKSFYSYETPTIDTNALRRYIKGLSLSYASAGYGSGWTDSEEAYQYNLNANTQYGDEKTAAIYIDAPVRWGDLTVTPGFRFEHTEVHNVYWKENFDSDDNPESGAFEHNDRTFNMPLPSLNMAWRPTDNSVYRFSYSHSYTRPSMFLLGGNESISSNGDGTYSITEGNPNLKPVVADNFDISGDWKFGKYTHLSVGAYYKTIGHYLFDAGSSTSSDGTHYVSTNTSSTVGSNTVTMPRNGGGAHAYGLELSASQRLFFLPSYLQNLELSGNLTIQRTAANLNVDGVEQGGRMQYAPNQMYNLSLYYMTESLQAGFSYRYTGRYLETYYLYDNSYSSSGSTDLSWWDRPTQSLDFSLKYNIRKDLQWGLSAKNLMGNYSYYATRGNDSKLIPQIVDSGRSYFITLTYNMQ